MTKYLRPQREDSGSIPEPEGPWRLPPRYDEKELEGIRAWTETYDQDRVMSVRATDDFGKVGQARGRIVNRREVFQDLWTKLGHPGREPDVLAIVVGGVSRFGHAAVAIKKDHGSSLQVVDIVNPAAFEEAKLVNLVEVPDYFFGAEEKPSGTEQGEAYWRSLDLVALWNVDETALARMHDYAQRLDVRDELGYAHFDMTTGKIRNLIGTLARRDENRYRNCAGFMAALLKQGGLIDQTTIFPKKLATDVLAKAAAADPDNVDVIKIPWVWSPLSAEK